MSKRHDLRDGRIRKSLASRHRRRPAVEFLEERRLLATVYWTSSSSGDWNTAGDWSTGKVPGSGDDVVINPVSGATPTVTISSGNQSVHSIMGSDPLAIAGGSLTVAATSAISGGLSMTGGSLVANGSKLSLTISGATTVSGASLYAEGGATLSLPELASYTQPNGCCYVGTLEATGAGSVLSLPELTSIANTGFETQVLASPAAMSRFPW